jgi:hypothetical protein
VEVEEYKETSAEHCLVYAKLQGESSAAAIHLGVYLSKILLYNRYGGDSQLHEALDRRLCKSPIVASVSVILLSFLPHVSCQAII